MASLQRIGKTATQVFHSDGVFWKVTYHKTDVVTVNQDGSITLDTGGWFTQTTKNRMNQASNQYGLCFRVYQAMGVWYVSVGCNGTVELKKFNGNKVTIRINRPVEMLAG